MSKINRRKIGAIAALLLILTTSRSDAAEFASYDAAVHDARGFAFADFDDFFAVDTSGGVMSIDINNDIDMANGLFGGMGADFVADFNPATTQLEIMLTVDPLNVASSFNIVLVDNDGVDTGEEYQFSFNLTGVTPGLPTLLTQSLVSPGPVFRQAAFNQMDGDMIQNYGLRQIQIQSAFGGTDRLKIDVDSVKLVDPDDPLLIEFNTTTYEAQTQKFTFGTFSETGVLDASGSTFLINADPAGTGGPSGGFGFTGLNVDFDAADYQIEIEARLLGNNTADQFNLLLGDNDGDDSGPGLGSEDFNFFVDTANFNTSTFSTFTIPLGSGSETDFVTTFGFTNGGDGLQNFGLSQMQIQASGDDPGVLGIEILRFSIVERPPGIAGDFDGDGDVDGHDFLVWQRNPAVGDLSDWQTNYGAPPLAAATSVPEPATWMLLLCATGAMPIRRITERS
ncbi:hypothetical protein [Bythopirellula polymerisocia]|uniref:PEP-CTERM protein-sorting domain-containing protein n=1 Tax=Bythopirellula polymerisocia TaxID=2528003 RepID=A0A5C6D0D5_9BACT|nr:hypothetical protein [Bythopirellula polymerisocia]TWU28359.1 hypothetical protein Pla144_16470 [Bythopirellula polymerisocia]